jgi:hypothetical protein
MQSGGMIGSILGAVSRRFSENPSPASSMSGSVSPMKGKKCYEKI